MRIIVIKTYDQLDKYNGREIRHDEYCWKYSNKFVKEKTGSNMFGKGFGAGRIKYATIEFWFWVQTDLSALGRVILLDKDGRKKYAILNLKKIV